jgi:hypothetical protein
MWSHKAPRNAGSTSRPLKLTPGIARFDARHINYGFARISPVLGIGGDYHRRASSLHLVSRSRIRAFGAWNFNRLSRSLQRLRAPWAPRAPMGLSRFVKENPRTMAVETLTND